MTAPKSNQPTKQTKQAEAKKTETALDEKQLDKVSGGAGNLYNACCTGKHISTGTV
jgi:hypothetical protein